MTARWLVVVVLAACGGSSAQHREQDPPHTLLPTITRPLAAKAIEMLRAAAAL